MYNYKNIKNKDILDKYTKNLSNLKIFIFDDSLENKYSDSIG